MGHFILPANTIIITNTKNIFKNSKTLLKARTNRDWEGQSVWHNLCFNALTCIKAKIQQCSWYILQSNFIQPLCYLKMVRGQHTLLTQRSHKWCSMFTFSSYLDKNIFLWSYVKENTPTFKFYVSRLYIEKKSLVLTKF